MAPPTRLTLDLALQGGGCKGIALNAALAEVMRRGHRIRRLVGTSAGAIAASLAAVGYTGDELVAMSQTPREDGKLEFAEYLTEPLVPASPDVEPELTELHVAALKLPGDLGKRLVSAAAMLRFLDTGGISSGEGFMSWYLRKLEAKRPGLSRITLGALHRETGRDLTLITTDTTAKRLRALNHRTAPDVPLAAAVRMSMSIPLLFAEVPWRSHWGPYLGTSLAGHVMVDGGLSSNLPVAFILPNANALVRRMMGEAPAEPGLPVGIGIDTTLEVPGAPAADDESFGARILHSRLGRRVQTLVDTMLLGSDLTVADAAPVPPCLLPARGYGAAEFDMSVARAEALLEAARAATASYLDDLEARAGGA
ncbi:MAG: patatin-like phospholipase family protein [Myxococcota bacterium]